METNLTFDAHPLEETLEEYCFNRLPDESTAAIEEHLLVCETCQHALEVLDEYISLMKAATAQCDVATSRPSTESVWSRVWDAWSRPFHPATFRAAVALGSFGAIAVLSWAMISMVTARRIETPQLTASVILTAVRGGENLTMSQAPSGRPLDLTMDVADLPASDAYRLEVVSAQGQRVWEAHEPALNGKLSARVPKGLSPGIYWVRLYSAKDELLREFGLRLH